MSFEKQRLELESLGFKVKESTPDSLIALRKKWHWDCLFTRLTTVVFLKKVDRLDAETLERDRQELSNRAKQLDGSLLPRGFQKGVAVLIFYVAKEVTEEAKKICLNKPKVRFAFFYLPTAIEERTQTVYSLKETPLWGFIYYGKFRYLVNRLFGPPSLPSKEPLSGVGIGITFFILFILIAELGVVLTLFK